MFGKKDPSKISFFGVGQVMILFGAVVTGFGLVSWYLRMFGYPVTCSYPFFKAMGGLVIIGMGYLILELELLRKK